ncbi:MAG: rRNA maturation RNase YbeY [Emcibacteraceae bacterium]|nr:rRNA maturation RNase YbeY [Emcibacteraceae bacterium]
MSLPEGLELEVSVDYDRWAEVLPEYEKIICTCCELIVDNISEGKALTKFSHIELSVVLCDDALIHKLNNDYRHKDKATNVLSFEGLDQGEVEQYLQSTAKVPERPFSLGEIYIAYETVSVEAENAGISFKDHFVHLVIHGILHLLSYDHIKDEEAELMEAKETELLKILGIDDPYAA